ncbi:MAG TPA: hypothetical protein EYG92_00955 [Lutibacter sp.]|nr:hypothetical protein [Lutibacter sp.]
MKYQLLSKEQFEELHKEFSTFLATQKIDKKSWDAIKENKPKKAITQLENFSDLVWEEVIRKTEYLEHYSKDSINLFHCKLQTINRIVVRIENKDINLQEKKGLDWFLDNSNDPTIQYFKGEKDYATSRNEEIFKLIEQGAVLANETLFNGISQLIKPATS